MREFVKIGKYGSLFVDKIIFESYYPIIFTCKNESGNIFICVCYQDNGEGRKWMVGKTTTSAIIKLLRDEITLRELLLDFCDDKYNAWSEKRGIVAKKEQEGWQDKGCLPKVDSYLYADEGEFDEEIHYFAGLNLSYATESYKNIIKKITTPIRSIQMDVETVAWLTNTLKELTIPAELMNTLKDIREISVQATANASLQYKDKIQEKQTIEMSFCTDTEELSVELKKIGTTNMADAA